MANMNKIKPNWLNIVIFDKESGGKRNSDTLGSKFPRTEGPKTIPATISPITVGWPIFRNSQPNILQTINMAMIWSSKIPIEECMWWVHRVLMTTFYQKV